MKGHRSGVARPTQAEVVEGPLSETNFPTDPDSVPTVLTGDGAGAMAQKLLPEPPGRYEIVREHARGGQSIVFVAYDDQLGREVAFKQLLPDRRSPIADTRPLSGIEARFLREARITGQLQHPGIVPVHEVGLRADGSLYSTQKLVRGRDLRKEIERCASLADRLRLLPAFLGICQAVAYAHRRGVIHRDLKPSNVMVGSFGEALVLDWGLAKILREKETPADDPLDSMLGSGASRTRDGAVLGTPAYMSPEQAAGANERVDERTDVWSLGAILFELLTAGRPFPGESTDEVLAKVTTAPVPRVLDLCAQAPGELAAIAERALTRDLDARYRDAGSLAAELSTYLSGGRVAAYAYSFWELTWRWLVSNRLLATGAAALLLLAMFALGNAVANQRRKAAALETKAAADASIAALDAEIERESDPTRRDALEGKLFDSIARARSAVAQLVAANPAAAAALDAGRDATTEGIQRILRRFGVDSYVIPATFVERVRHHVARITSSPSAPHILARRATVWPLISSELAKRGLPEEMGYVAWTESQFDPQAESHVGARGMWQFMPGTARVYGLRVDADVDERLDVEKSTRAASGYLAALMAEFGADAFMLALAAYNKGEHGLRRVLRQIALEHSGWRPERREFWHLYRRKRLPAETLEYVPAIFAAMIVGSDPARHGL